MAALRMDHVGVVVEDLGAAKEFFAALGLEPGNEGAVEGRWVDRVVGLEGVRADIAFMQTQDGHGRLELVKFHSPPGPACDPNAPANVPGIGHIAFAVDDVDAAVARLQALGAELVGEIDQYEDLFRLCYIRGPEGIIVELTEKVG